MKKTWMQGTLWMFLLAAFAACQSGPPEISITAAGAELSPATVGEAMVTMTIVNRGGKDMLGAVKTDIPGATTTFHVMQGQRMTKVDMLEVPARRNLEFKMGSDHIMIENMPKTMTEGSAFMLTLVFEKSGERQVPLTLQKATPMQMDHGHKM